MKKCVRKKKHRRAGVREVGGGPGRARYPHTHQTRTDLGLSSSAPSAGAQHERKPRLPKFTNPASPRHCLRGGGLLAMHNTKQCNTTQHNTHNTDTRARTPTHRYTARQHMNCSSCIIRAHPSGIHQQDADHQPIINMFVCYNMDPPGLCGQQRGRTFCIRSHPAKAFINGNGQDSSWAPLGKFRKHSLQHSSIRRRPYANQQTRQLACFHLVPPEPGGGNTRSGGRQQRGHTSGRLSAENGQTYT